MFKDFFSFAFKNLKHRGIRSWLTLLGIFIGVVAVVSLISLGGALKVAVSSQFGISTTEVITVQAGGLNSFGPPGSAVVKPLTIDDLKAIEKISSVENAIRRNLPTGKLEFNDRAIFGIATNIPDGEDRDFVYNVLETEAEFGRLLKDGDSGKVFLGNNFYADSVGLGKKVVVGNTVKVQGKSFKVVGILKKKGSFIFDNLVYMNERDLQNLMGYEDDVDLIVVQVKSKDLMDKTKIEIEKVLRKRRDVKVGEEDFEVTTPDAALSTVNNVLSGVQAFVAIIALISVFVGSIGIVNTMTTSVLERKKEIGIMKAIGAKNEHIFFQFFIEASLLGLMGGIVGVIFGTLVGIAGTIGLNNFLGGAIPFNIDFLLIFLTLIGTFLIGGIAGIVPAMNAAKLNPVEALAG